MEKYDSSSFTTEGKTSKYNSAGDQLQRIDKLWELSHKFSRSGEYNSWNKVLDRIWLELAGDLDMGDKAIDIFNEFNRKLVELNIEAVRNVGFNKPQEDYKEVRSKQYFLLMEKELYIRRLQNKLGKGTAWRDEFEDDF